MAQPAHTPAPWLFGPATDVAVFAGSVGVSGAVALGLSGAGHAELPTWAWALFVLGVDVAHVWATLYRVYADREERARRPELYAAAPLLAYGLGFAAYQHSPLLFWRLFAYSAAWHFVRQQVGWGALYNRRAHSPAWEAWLDAAVLYGCTLGPLLWWHAHLPRPFDWFVPGDFLPGLPPWAGGAALGLSGTLGAAWLLGQAVRWARGGGLFAGRWVLVLSTAAAWLGSIVLAPDDVTFTLLNVGLHGVPYFALLYRYARSRDAEGGYAPWLSSALRFGVPGFFAVVLGLAYAEEWLWDTFVWHEHAGLFGKAGVEPSQGLLSLLVPALALPQATHYLLDGFTWRGKENPGLEARLGWAPPPGPSAPPRAGPSAAG
jgi:hypothetical protein